MKVLKIEQSKGYFLTKDRTYDLLDNLDKGMLLHLVNLAFEDSFVIDEYDEKLLPNQAHQIIYKSISAKLVDLHKKRQQFKDESENLYRAEYDIYKS